MRQVSNEQCVQGRLAAGLARLPVKEGARDALRSPVGFAGGATLELRPLGAQSCTKQS